jgi:hypothetical protein
LPLEVLGVGVPSRSWVVSFTPVAVPVPVVGVTTMNGIFNEVPVSGPTSPSRDNLDVNAANTQRGRPRWGKFST